MSELPLQLETRKKIYSQVESIPGIHIQDLRRRLGIAIGNLMYHLRYLEKHNLVSIDRQGYRYRIFPLSINDNDRRILSILREQSIRQIILVLFQQPNCNHQQIVRQLRLSPSVVTYHLKTLLQHSLVRIEKHGRMKYYSLNSREQLIKTLIVYRHSFFDKLVDNFLDTWEK